MLAAHIRRPGDPETNPPTLEIDPMRLVTFAASFPLLMIPNITIAVRTFFAWALDGLLP